MGVKGLAEAVILQSLDDLWDPLHRTASMDFFSGDGYTIFARLAELNKTGQHKLKYIPWGEKYVDKDRVFRHRKYHN